MFCYLSIVMRLRFVLRPSGFVLFCLFCNFFWRDLGRMDHTVPQREDGWLFFFLLGWGRGRDLYCTIACGLENAASEFVCMGCEKGEAFGTRWGGMRHR